MKYLNLFALLLIFSVNAFADIPLPKPSPKSKAVDVRMNIRFSRQATMPTLSIPRSAIKGLRAQLEETDEDANSASAASTNNFSRTQTIVSGLFLSLGVIFGGVWLARSRKSGALLNKKIAAGLITVFIASAASVALANVGPPTVLRSISSRLFDKQAFTGGAWQRARGDVQLQISDNDGEIQLVIPDAEGRIASSEE